jgi:hypothetical protein
MTLTIEVSGELEAALKAQASEQGLNADRIARRVLAQVLTPGADREEGAFRLGRPAKRKPAPSSSGPKATPIRRPSPMRP